MQYVGEKNTVIHVRIHCLGENVLFNDLVCGRLAHQRHHRHHGVPQLFRVLIHVCRVPRRSEGHSLTVCPLLSYVLVHTLIPCLCHTIRTRKCCRVVGKLLSVLAE